MRVFIAFFIAMAFLGSCHTAQAEQINKVEQAGNIMSVKLDTIPVTFVPVRVYFNDGVVMDCVVGEFYRFQMSCVKEGE